MTWFDHALRLDGLRQLMAFSKELFEQFLPPDIEFHYFTQDEIEFNNMIGHPPKPTYYFWLGEEEVEKEDE